MAVEAAIDGEIDPQRFEAAMAALGDGLLRAKGFMRLATGWRLFDWASGVVSWRDSGSGIPALVLLVRPQAAALAREVALGLSSRA